MALSDNLVSAYLLEETSGTRYDSVGSNDLTDNNTVTYTGSGKNNNAASFNSANSEYLNGGDVHSYTDDFAISCWVYVPSRNDFATFVGYGQNAGSPDNAVGYILHSGFNNKYVFAVSDGSNTITAATSSGASTSAWHHVMGWWDSADGKCHLSIDGAVSDSSSTISAPAKPVIAQEFNVGRSSDGGYFNGYIDEVYIWNAVKDSTDRAELYNSGTGTFYPFTSGYTLDLGAGSYTLSGTALTPTHDRIIVPAAGSYSLSGTALAPTYDRKLVPEAGSLVLSGTTIGHLHNKTHPVEAGSYTLSGTALSPTHNRTILLDSASFTLSGTDLSIYHDRSLGIGAGAYVITGSDVTLTYTGDQGYTIPLEAGSYTLSGAAVDLLQDRTLVVDAGSYSLDGKTVTLTYSGGVVAERPRRIDRMRLGMGLRR